MEYLRIQNLIKSKYYIKGNSYKKTGLTKDYNKNYHFLL